MSLLTDIQITDRLGLGAGLPREMMMDIAPTAVNASHKIVSLQPTTTSTVGPSQTIQFLIPQKNLMRSHSAYLKFKFTPTSTDPFSFAGAAQSAAALINSIQLSAGNVVVENLLNYHLFHNNILLAHAHTPDILGVEAIASASIMSDSISPASYTQANYTGAAGYAYATSNLPNSTVGPDYEFTIPLFCGLFFNKNSTAIPLFAIGGGLNLTLQTNPTTKAFYSGSASQPSTYSITDIQFIFDEITPSLEYIQTVQSGLNAGKLIKLECESYLNTLMGAASSVRQQISLNMSSLDAILFGYVKSTDSTNTSKFFISPSTSLSDWRNTTRFEVYLDNQVLFNSNINNFSFPSVQIRELTKALSASCISDRCAPIVKGVGANNTDVGRYLSQGNLKGLNTKNFVSEDVSMSGTRVLQCQVQFQDTNTNSADSYYLYFMYSYIMLVDAAMSVSKIM